MKIWSSFEALVVVILEVKTGCNFTARFKSYSFFKNNMCYQLAYGIHGLTAVSCRVLRPPGAFGLARGRPEEFRIN
jgi:hypothetical protein